ncbi:MAG: cytochrome c biogenesis protein CcsA [Planctomycetes bacterium]|nr:cytochrome c biogenesis protein CcsA [Planctomycetota bacterium]
MARPVRWSRFVEIFFGVAGLLAHTIFLAYHQPSPATPYGSLLLLAWVFAVFYLYGVLHREPYPWAIFVLPLVLGLVGLSFAFVGTGHDGSWFTGERFWGMVHGMLLLLASVGITVGFLASIMYLIQVKRLKMKRNPIGGMKLLSLERLERMNRRAVNIAFPLLTVGLLLGLMRLWQTPHDNGGWTALKITSTVGLWLVGALLMFLRYGAHLPGRRLAQFTILVFIMMLVALVTSHPFAPGDTR